MGVFHGGSNDHFLAQWGLFLGREGVQQLRRERARQTNMALPFVHRQRGLKPSQSVRPNRSPKAAFSSEHFLPKGKVADKRDILFRHLPGKCFGSRAVAM